jgi:hypothetical protein
MEEKFSLLEELDIVVKTVAGQIKKVNQEEILNKSMVLGILITLCIN